MSENQEQVKCGGGWVCHGTTHIEGCLSGDQLRNAQQIAVDVHRDLPNEVELDVAFAEFKRRVTGSAK